MADLTIKPQAGSSNKLILQDQQGGTVLETATSGATLGNSTQDNITRLGTVTTGTMNNTIGSSATFPSGHILQHHILEQGEDIDSHISTNSTSFADMGVNGSFTTRRSSADSWLRADVHSGMCHINSSSEAGLGTIALKSSDSTTYSVSDEMLVNEPGTANSGYTNRYGGHQSYMPYHAYGIMHVGHGITPANLTTYSAGQTLYVRFFARVTNGSNHFYPMHVGTHFLFTIMEIER